MEFTQDLYEPEIYQVTNNGENIGTVRDIGQKGELFMVRSDLLPRGKDKATFTNG